MADTAGPLLVSQIATEYAALKAPHNCPEGMYVMPSPESVLRWAGVFFVRGELTEGPYDGAVLQFNIRFPETFPRDRPHITFETKVFHHMIDPKTLEWTPRGRLAQWQPHVDHVVHLLYALSESFTTSFWDTVEEQEASNNMYHHSRDTFLSMAARRAKESASREVLFGGVPVKGFAETSSLESKDKVIQFADVDEEASARLQVYIRRSLGVA